MNNNTELSIKVKKIIKNGGKYYEVIDIVAFKEDELPDQYFDSKPYCYISEDEYTFIIRHVMNECITIEIGSILKIDTYNKVVKIMKECGSKLHMINQELKIEKENWHGVETIKI